MLAAARRAIAAGLLAGACGPGPATPDASPTTAAGAGAGERVAAAWPAATVGEVLALEGDPEAGARAYRSCAVCHGEDGRGRPDGTFPLLAGQHRSVLVKQLVDIREGRRHNPVMEPYAEALIDAQDLADVASYVGSLPPPERPGATPVPPEHREEGERLYARDCQGCHGARGEGDAERFVPMLAGQHPAYLLRQIRAIAAGRRDNGHPEMTRRVSDYTDAELQAVIQHATRLPGPARDGARERSEG